MSFADSPRLAPMRSSVISVLVGLGSALYVYRIPLGEVNITILRFTTLVLAGCLVWQLLRRRIKTVRAHWILIAGIAVLVYLNAIWYFSIDAHPGPRREIIAHYFNLITMLAIVMWVNDEQQLLRLVNGYLLASILAIIIGYYGLFFNAIPLEESLRVHGSAYAQSLTYISDDGSFQRLTGPFLDPNFFGVYLLTVLIYSIWMYFFRNRNVVYLIIAIAALVTLPLTISRTAMVGLFAFFIVCVFWLPRKYRRAVILMSLVLAPIGVLGVWIFAGEFLDRVLDSHSLVERNRFVSAALSAFAAYPFFGAGPAGIVDERTGIATAHFMYVSVLARFGVLGAIPYFVFIFYPLVRVLIGKRTFLREYRFIVVGLYSSFLVMYLFYDFLFFLEFQYFVFATGYSVVFYSFARNDRPSSSAVFDGSLPSKDNNRYLCESRKCVE